MIRWRGCVILGVVDTGINAFQSILFIVPVDRSLPLTLTGKVYVVAPMVTGWHNGNMTTDTMVPRPC